MTYIVSWYPTDGFDQNYEGTTWTAQSIDDAVTKIKSRIQSYPGTSTGSIMTTDVSLYQLKSWRFNNLLSVLLPANAGFFLLCSL